MTPTTPTTHSWNTQPTRSYSDVVVEDDLRDSLQSVRASRPSLDHRRQVLDLEAEIGVRMAFLGFPAASEPEQNLCAELVAHISNQHLPITPILMARALERDIEPILRIAQQSSVEVLVDLYIPTSTIRMQVEGWTLDRCLEQLHQVAAIAEANGLDYRVAFEDSTRTSPQDLRRALALARELGTPCVVLNDTAGDCLPEGARAHVAFARAELEGSGIALAWHGHNDRGLALANALAAIDGGARIASGTWLGVGERTGNIALEQLIHVLHMRGGRFRIDQLTAMADLIRTSLDVVVPPNMPIVGTDAFSTSTGTHAAAIVKARRLGPAFEDRIYSGVSAHALGRIQEILIGPNSGRGAIQTVLTAFGFEPDEDTVQRVLHYCKSTNRCLTDPEEVRTVIQTQIGTTTPR
ncbi:hypothetical protein [Nocardia sp. A7]|uniref:hypothetical protein n=1 Tax=Nocardia sp. A7 TaxID=2789274 RepID=UPI0039797734